MLTGIKVAGTICVFTLLSVGFFLFLSFLDTAGYLELGEISLSHGQLPDGGRFSMTKGLIVILAIPILFGVLGAIWFWKQLQRGSGQKVAAIAMLPIVFVVLLAIFVATSVEFDAV